MPGITNKRRVLRIIERAVIEIGFILFLFYANLLMGEYTVTAGKGKTLTAALHNIFTSANLAIAVIAATVGYLVFERLRANS